MTKSAFENLKVAFIFTGLQMICSIHLRSFIKYIHEKNRNHRPKRICRKTFV